MGSQQRGGRSGCRGFDGDAGHRQRRGCEVGFGQRTAVFVPDEIKVKVGDSVTWTGNKGLPHNVVFDEENVPDGVDAEALSHADNVGDEGEKVTTKFTKAGTYGYYCEPHRGAGMNGTVIVQ